MTDEHRDLLRKIVTSIMEEADNAEVFKARRWRWSQAEVVYWLREQERRGDSEAIASIEPFYLTGDADGIAWLSSGAGVMVEQWFMDVKAIDEGDAKDTPDGA